ncbi:MAG TPA: flagellar assembly peptidoglycan hydrolase FlgJ [Steroidobacteraceae bacterium]
MTTPVQTKTLPLAIPTSTSNANTYTDPNGLAALKKDPNSPQAIRAVAQQVDALFMQMMLKSMRDASAAVGESDSNEMGMYQDMFDKQIALTMSQHQGLGLGSLLARQLAAKGSPAVPAPAASTASPAGAKALATTTAPSTAPGAPASTTPTTSGVPTSQNAPTLMQSAAEFVDKVLPTIRVAAQILGVDPLGMLAQAALETGWGNRMPRTADGAPSMNLFGIKADENWAGARATANTVEYSGGVATLRHTAFRAYGSVEESVKDFANLLKNSPRYRQVIGAGASARDYAQGMGRSGYATDPEYANKLNEILNSGTLRTALLQAATVKL